MDFDSAIFSPAPREGERLPLNLDSTLLEGKDDSDIYRGEPPSPPRSPAPESTTSSSSSTSSGSIGGGRLGAIAAVVELAITRWARRRSSSSSSSSSSISSRSSITVSRSQHTRRRKRRPSLGNSRSIQSERDITARLKAREESRQVPREFILYLPPSTRTQSEADAKQESEWRRVIYTTSLSLILGQLDTALKKTIKSRRHHARHRSPGSRITSEPSRTVTSQSSHLLFVVPEQVETSSRRISFSELDVPRKEKHKAAVLPRAGRELFPPNKLPQSVSKAWFLDVASPTWDDMRTIGKLLHLHPLTLEDILQQDPREKLELFPKLGYYFISFRAIESSGTREKIQRGFRRASDGSNIIMHDEGSIGEANVYLIVFNEGVCSFHFTDISEHTNRVRNRILQLEEVINMSSDWIAHGILDSIVDSFFPFLEEIEREVVAIDDLVFSGDSAPTVVTENPISSHSPTAQSFKMAEKQSDLEQIELDEKSGSSPLKTSIHDHTQLASSFMILSRISRYLHAFWRSLSLKPGPLPSATTLTLRRMARTRRLVTSLTRLLATKSEVVTQVTKRLTTSGRSGLGNGGSKAEDLEVAIYMGDVQDHILTLQHALAHYERMLSQSHPSYLFQLRTTVLITKSGTDKGIFFLTVVSIAVLCIQTLIGTFSLNITIPANGLTRQDPYIVFGIIVALACIILCLYLSVVRLWWIQAKRQRRGMDHL